VEGGTVNGSTEEDDVRREAGEGDEEAERLFQIDREPDRPEKREDGENDQPESYRRGPMRGGSAGAHGGKVAPPPARSPEEVLKSS
jgi:hypothetical protein